MYDLIGDIHGHARELMFLLEMLGYDRQRGDAYSHPSRKVIFVGDLIDRGPAIREVLHLVKGMVDAGSAECVMGNHEFNALAYHTRHPANPDEFLRRHDARGGKNVQQHFETLRQVPPGELSEFLGWFRQRPLWRDLEVLRVVHACWDPPSMQRISQDWNPDEGITTKFLTEATDPDSELFAAVEDVLKGKEIRLPEGVVFHDKDGHVRRKLRVKWYTSPVNQTYHTYAFQSGEEFPSDPLPEELADRITPYAPVEPPVFFGHYWMKSEHPAPLASNVCCLDYSVAKSGHLVAYRWNGENTLSEAGFRCLPAFSHA